MQNRQHHQARRGTAATEFAIVLPVLMLLMLGGADFGRIAYYSDVVSNAARAGAEVGATRRFTSDTRPQWELRIRNAVVEELQSLPDFNVSQLDFTLGTSTDSQDVVCVRVEVSYPFTCIVNWPMLPHKVKLRESVQYRQFR
jgi:Flp pilus assembly protein TadG